MIDVLIIDKTNHITSNLLDLQAQIQVFNNEIKALNVIESQSAPVVLLNYDFLKEQTVEYIKLLVSASSNSKIVVLANELSDKETLNCLLAGAKGYQQLNQLKDYSNRLVTVMDAGEAWITRRMTATLLDALRMK